MYELRRIKTSPRVTKERPETEIMSSHGPIITGIPAFFHRENGEMFRTSEIIDIDLMHENITRFYTKSGSVYELKKI